MCMKPAVCLYGIKELREMIPAAFDNFTYYALSIFTEAIKFCFQ